MNPWREYTVQKGRAGRTWRLERPSREQQLCPTERRSLDVSPAYGSLASGTVVSLWGGGLTVLSCEGIAFGNFSLQEPSSPASASGDLVCVTPSLDVNIFDVSTSVAEDRNIFVLMLSSDRNVVQGSFSYSTNVTPFVEALSLDEKLAAIITWVDVNGTGLGGGVQRRQVPSWVTEVATCVRTATPPSVLVDDKVADGQSNHDRHDTRPLSPSIWGRSGVSGALFKHSRTICFAVLKDQLAIERLRCCWTRLLWVPHCEERPGAAHSRRDHL